MIRQEIKEHRQNFCSKRIVQCEHCRNLIQYDALNMHHQKCQEYPVTCPRECELGKTGLKRKDLHSHSQVCPLEPLNCSDCKARLLRRELDKHRNDLCPKRKMKCKYCDRVGAYDQITGGHVNECSEFPVGCPRKCEGNDQMKRKCLKDHAKVCLLEPVQCPFDNVGCSPQLVRKDLNSHLESNMQRHMLKLMAAHSQLVTEHRKLVTEHNKLKYELASTQETQSEMAMTISHELNLMEGHQQSNATSLQCIRTVLNPNLKDVKDTLSFHVPQIKQKWSSLPFCILEVGHVARNLED